MKFNYKFLSGRNHLPHKNNISGFTIFRFWPCVIHYKSLIRGSKINCLFLVLQAFIFTVKNIFAAWTDPEGWEVPQKYADKEVKRLRELRRWKEAWDLAVKWRLAKKYS